MVVTIVQHLNNLVWSSGEMSGMNIEMWGVTKVNGK